MATRQSSLIPQFDKRHFLFFHQLVNRYKSREVMNAHQGIEIVLVLEGSGQAILDGKVYPVTGGSLLLCQPFQLHHYKMERRYVRSPLVFDPYVFECYIAPFPALHAFFQKLWKGALEKQVFALQAGELAAFKRIYDAFHERLQEASGLAEQEELGLFLVDLLRELRKLYASGAASGGGEGNAAKREMRYIEQMMGWIEEHYREDFSLERLAQNLHLSPFYASRLFKQETGCSLSQYIMARRIRESCLLLMMTNKPVAQIGQLAGFNSSAYFCRQFKRKMGVSPQAFRKRIL